jgi:CRP-like cAMP-binding protein
MKIHFENQYKTNNNMEDWETMFSKFPPQLRSDIVKVTHGTIISTIKFFQNRKQDFLIRLIPKLKLNSYFDNDIVYSQGDQAEELFFIFHGEVLFYKDVSEVIDMREVVRMESAFNIPFASYSAGSYFGDNDALLHINGQRAYTCICQ